MKFAILTLTAATCFAQDCSSWSAKGVAHYEKKEWTEALIAFRAAIQCDPKSMPAHLAVAAVLAEQGNDNEALAVLLETLDLEPKNVEALRAVAGLYLKSGLHTKAQPVLERLVAVAPKLADAHSDLASVYAASGNREKAEAEFRKALSLSAGSFPALSGLGNLLARAGDNDTALPLLRRAVSARPNAYEGHFLLGSAYNRLNQFEEARRELELAVSLGGSKEPQVHYQLARAWGGLGNQEQRRVALARFSELTKKEKDDSESQRRAAALVDEARQLLQAGDLANATRKLELAREARPADATLLFRLAGLNYDMQRYDAAREYVQGAISLSPSTWLHHYLLGLIERSANRLNDAKASFGMAAKLGPSEAQVFNALGEVLLEQGARDRAIEAFEKACKLAPQETAFRANLEFARKSR